MALTAAPKITVPWANSGVNRNTIPVASQISITPGAASYTDGFPPLCMTPIASGGIPPAGPDFNGVLYSLSQSLQWLQSGSGYPFDGAFATAVGGYPLYARVQRSDGQGLWINTVANNNVDPESSTSSGWLPLTNNVTTAITMTSSNVTLTALQAGAGIIYLSGTLTANLNLVFPTWSKEWLVVNNCTGSFSVTCKTASGTGVAIAAGSNAIVYGDGTNINSASAMVLASSTESQALTNVAKAITPATLASAFQGSNQSLVANGYQKFPGGLIIQWGISSAMTNNTTEDTYSQSFPIVFPNGCLQVVVGNSGSPIFDAVVQVSTFTASTVTFVKNVMNVSSPTTGTLQGRWIAIGY